MPPGHNYLTNLTPQQRTNTAEKILASLDATGDCWTWTGAASKGKKSKAPRPIVKIPGSVSPRIVYRILWEYLIGPCPDGLEPDHLCKNTMCANVGSHIEWVTPAENRRRSGLHAARLAHMTNTCPAGHPHDKIFPTFRRCSICDRTNAQLRAIRLATLNQATS